MCFSFSFRNYIAFYGHLLFTLNINSTGVRVTFQMTERQGNRINHILLTRNNDTECEVDLVFFYHFLICLIF